MFDFIEPTFWFTLALIFLIIEFIGGGSLFASIFAGSALLTGIISFQSANLYLLFGVFFIFTFLLLFFIKPLLRTTSKIHKNTAASNIDAILNSTGFIKEEISAKEKGTVLINHEEWTAASTDESEIKEGTKVIVDSVVGVTLYVSTFKKEESGN